jgi:hypothetical protein
VRHFRMPRRAFDDLVAMLRCQGPGGAEDTAFLTRRDDTRPCVSGHRSYYFRMILALTMYFLGHASTMSELSNVFGVPPSTAHQGVEEGVTALKLVRVLLYGVGGNVPVVKFPQSEEEKLAVIGGFEIISLCQELIGHMRWCIGAIDGTHIAMRKPDIARCPQGRDIYHSWKSKISMLLVWIVDARGRALYATTGHPGSSSDAGVWGRDPLRNELQRGRLPVLKRNWS